MTSVAYGVALPATRGLLSAPHYAGESVRFFARLATQPTEARKSKYDAMIRSLVTSGVWSKLDALYAFAATDEATALTNLVQPGYGATAVNSPTFGSDVGYTGATLKYVDTNFNPATAVGANYTRDGASLFAWCLTSAAVGGPLIGQKTDAISYLYSRYSSNQTFLKINRASAAAFASADGSGFKVATRTASNAEYEYRNGALLQSDTSSSVAPSNNSFTAFYGDGGLYAAAQIALMGIGGALTAQNVSDLYNAARIYLQAVGTIP